MSSYAMVIDLSRCVGCMACVIACKAENDVPPGQFRTQVVTEESGTFPKLGLEFRSELCNHCDNPPCVDVCPEDATFKDPKTGMVKIDRKKCIGCEACVEECPYNARYYNEKLEKVDKCSFCEHRVKAGQEPACVATCVGRSRVFGDLDDPKSEVRALLKNKANYVLLKEAGTKPRVFYINKPGKVG